MTGEYLGWHCTAIEHPKGVYNRVKYTYVAIKDDKKLTAGEWHKLTAKLQSAEQLTMFS